MLIQFVNEVSKGRLGTHFDMINAPMISEGVVDYHCPELLEGRQQEMRARGIDNSSAPENPRLWHKVGVTTVIAAVVFIIIYLVAEAGLINFRVE